MKGIAYWIQKWAFTHPDRTAVITDNEKVSYRQLDKMIDSAAVKIHEKLQGKKGERIAILSHNRIEYIVLLFAIAKAECVAVPLNIRLSAKELIFQLNDSGSKLIFVEKENAEFAASLFEQSELESMEFMEDLCEGTQTCFANENPIDEEAPYIICYTSGTTGKPKGAVLTQSNMFWNAVNNKLAIDLTSEDRCIVLLPLFHIGGIGLFAFPSLFSGGTIVIPGKFEPEKALDMIEKHKVTIVMGVPTIHQALLTSPSFKTADLSTVRWFYNGGAPCPRELIDAYFDRGFLFGQGFGMTETSPTLFMLSKEDAPRKRGSIGKPVLFSEYKLIDSEGKAAAKSEVGELAVRGPNIMKEYWNRPDATEDALKDGWLLTGDLAKTDDEGFLFIVGRKKEMIISGGENIYPLEVEQVISQLKDVAEVAVVGNADPLWGEVPEAFIVKENGSALTEDDVIQYCHGNLAKYKIPKKVTFLKELPKNATGKIQKTQLLVRG
ncbi:o-succinylbenzoate--CoA ligase [Bacillus firmus]|uniref:o-succinylbenzoate--CoA ligase n=1 Tax=Cytobacillus firmus TaxID=1399 RepID=UPI00157FCA4D|nr:o-succinylbenzoate--CoA ligase [Cytobacillus firmus]MBG9654161.1 acyl-CoA synthetase [Cytobacillus firmus]MED1908253.1 o-succinylbenzoate--CoA ligase [Cytobacillus firmus]NUH85688.1 o-succinylbenzoate--CoA ligase [Cytobacillus firmus]